MKKMAMLVMGALSLMTVCGKTFDVNGIAVSDGPIVPGEWNSNFTAAKAYADENHCPIIAFWGKATCGHCNAAERDIGQSKRLAAWCAENEIVLTIAISGDSNFNTTEVSKLKSFAKKSGFMYFPYVRWYWQEEDGTEHNDWRENTLYADEMLSRAMKTFAGWSPGGVAGTVDLPDDPGNRLEFEAGTPSVTVKVVRREAHRDVAIDGEFQAVAPDGKVFFRTTIKWSRGETEKEVTVPLADAGCTKTGDQIAVGVLDEDGDLSHPGYITYVTGNSAANPLWIGERKVPAAAKMLMAAKGETPDYRFGEWTMDLDVATQTVAQTEGAFTLVSVQGSQWCPDCANTDRNFLDLKDDEADEQTKFQKWAAANKVALVTIDIPNFTDTEGAYSTPTLLSREVFKTTLARNSYTNRYGNTATPTKSTLNKSVFPKETPELTGADPALTNAMPRSGLGYLTRKGVSDAEAAKVLKRNHALVVTNTDKGGFHRPEDSNAKRTGVPIFVLLRRDGTVAGRFTTFAAVSPFKRDRESFDAFVKRIEELVKEDGQENNGEIANNDARTTALTLKAAGETTPTGGKSAKCLSHADAIDVFKLEGAAKGIRQLVTMTKPLAETGDGKVSLTLQRLVNGKPENVTQRVKKDDVPVTVTGLLSEGVALDYTFQEPGDYFIAVKADTADKGFAVNSMDSTWMAYSLQTAMLIDPVESMSTLTIDPSYETVFVRIVKNEYYCIEGLKFTRDGEHGLPGEGGVPGKLEGPYNIGGAHYYRALVSDNVVATLDGSGSLSYQIWHPGEVGFGTPSTKGDALKQEVSRKVKENVGVVEIPVSRVNGASDAVKVSVVLNFEKSVNIYAVDDGHPRFVETPEALTNEITWADGESGKKFHTIEILDDARFDDACKFVFDIVMAPGDGFAEIKYGTFELNVTENDRKSAGKASFTGVVGTYFAKSATVYAREDESVTLELSRLVGSDAVVTGLVKTTFGTVEPASVEWGFHDDSLRTVTVSGVPAGRTAKVSIDKTFGGLGKGSPSSVSVVSIATNAPEFASRTYPDEFGYAYVAVSNLYPVVNVAPGGTLSFTKLSGSLPSGLKATYDAAAQAMCLVGVPTKAATNTVVYQVVETVKNGRSTVKLPGLVTQITFVVADPAKAPAGVMPINTSCTTARTLADIPMVAAESKRLAGVLTLTIPKATGKVSAKYSCASGTVSFAAAKSWSALETEADGQFVAELAPSNKKQTGYSLTVEAFPDKQVRATLTDPAFPGEKLVFEHMGITWGDLMKEGAEYATGAKDWAGYYTVAMPMEKVVFEETAGYAADGTGYLTLKMADSAAKTGKMTWALMLPNGVTASGSSTLYPTGKFYENPNAESLEIASLPIFWTKGNERFSAVLKVLRGAAANVKVWNATVLGDADAPACWRHTAAAKDAAALIGFETEHGVYGGLYDSKADLGGCCQDAYDTFDLGFAVSVTNLVSGKYGEFIPVENPVAQVKVETSRLTVDNTWNPQSVKLSVARGTGIVTGSLKLQYVDPAKGEKDLSVSFKGILLQGWGNSCGCGDDVVPVAQPFVSGSWFLSDKIEYLKPGATRPTTVTDKRGGAFAVDNFKLPL